MMPRPVDDLDVVRWARIGGSSNRASAKIVDLDPGIPRGDRLPGGR